MTNITTNEEILKKAIEKAVKNGFKWDKIWSFEYPDYYALIFSHSFAKAFWNGKHKWYPQNKNDWYYKKYGAKAKRCMICLKDNFSMGYINPYSGNEVIRTDKICGENSWDYNLQQMVLEKEPIKYLEKFL